MLPLFSQKRKAIDYFIVPDCEHPEDDGPVRRKPTSNQDPQTQNSDWQTPRVLHPTEPAVVRASDLPLINLNQIQINIIKYQSYKTNTNIPTYNYCDLWVIWINVGTK